MTGKFVQGGMRVYICDHDTAPPGLYHRFGTYASHVSS